MRSKKKLSWGYVETNVSHLSFHRRKMRTINANQCVKIPRGIEASVKSRVVTIKGPRGLLKRNFKHLSLDIHMASKRSMKVEKWFGTKKELAAVRTVCSHILNMIKGRFFFQISMFVFNVFTTFQFNLKLAFFRRVQIGQAHMFFDTHWTCSHFIFVVYLQE